MDAARINTFKQRLRLRFNAASATPDIAGLKGYIESLDAEVESGIVINSQSFESGQATGQITLEPMEKMQAALDVLAEIDPDNTPPEAPNAVYARFTPTPYGVTGS